jgi:hypothetical protein
VPVGNAAESVDKSLAKIADPTRGCRRVGTRRQNRETATHVLERADHAPENAGCLGGRHIFVVERIEKAEAQDCPRFQRLNGRVEGLGDQRLQLMTGVHSGQPQGGENHREVETLSPGRVTQEKGVIGVRGVHQHHGVTAAEILDTQKLAQREDAGVAREQNEAVERLVQGEE